MKNIILSLTVIIIATSILVSCKNESTNTSTAKDTDTVVQQPKVDTPQKKTVDSSNQVVCKESEEKVDGENETIKTCTWSNYKSVSTGVEVKYKYYWTYEMFKLNNGKFVKIENSSLFNDKKTQLLSIINKKVKQRFTELSKDPQNKDCLSSVEKSPEYTFNQLGIYLEKDGFKFSYSFGLPDACTAVDGDLISFNINEIEPYLKK